MRRRITRVSVGQTSKVIASIYFVVAVVIAVIYFIAVSATGTNTGTFSPMLILLFPVIYGVIIWCVFALMLSVYNAVAARIGGVEFESVDVGS